MGWGDGSKATNAYIETPQGIAFDLSGNLYISDQRTSRVRVVSRQTSIISVAVGTGEKGYGGDNGPGTSAQLRDPFGLAFDRSGKLYIADAGNNNIRLFSPTTRIITTLVTSALNSPYDVAVDVSGNVFISDGGNYVVRVLTRSTSLMTTYAGTTGVYGYDGDGGPASNALLSTPVGLLLDASGNLFFSELTNSYSYPMGVRGRVRQVQRASGIISTFIGGSSFGDGGFAKGATLNGPVSVAVDSSGNLYFAETGSMDYFGYPFMYNYGKIRCITKKTGIITTMVGTETPGYSGDNGLAIFAQLRSPSGLTFDSSDNLYIADKGNNVVRLVKYPSNIIVTYVGGGIGNGAIASAAVLNAPSGVAIDTSGNVYIAEGAFNDIRLVNYATGIITTICGTPALSGSSGDGGLATAALLNNPNGVTADRFGNLYIVDTGNNAIRLIKKSTGIISTFAGALHYATAGSSGDGGPATRAILNRPNDIAVDYYGNVFIADSGNAVVRLVQKSSGTISTYAGTYTAGYSGDGGPAVNAQLSSSLGIALDALGNLFIADCGNNRLRQVRTLDRSITNLAGTGTPGFAGDGGLATSAYLSCPSAAAVDTSGNVYIVDTNNNRIRCLVTTTGIISTYAGTGTPFSPWSGGFNGDGGPASSAQLGSMPGNHFALAIDAVGNLYIADTTPLGSVRVVTKATGFIYTLSGGGNGDGAPATNAILNNPTSIAIDKHSNLLIADAGHGSIRLVSANSGIVTTYAGSNDFANVGAPATLSPQGIALDRTGNLYVTDHNSVLFIWKNDSSITAAAGGGYGDGVVASSAALNNPYGITIDANGNVYFADKNNNMIRVVSRETGIISPFAGTYIAGSTGDGASALSAQLNQPSYPVVDTSGHVFFMDNGKIRRVDITTTLISTYAGTGVGGTSGDNGPATNAQFTPFGLAVDPTGNIYISDSYTFRIRVVWQSSGIITLFAGTGISGSTGEGGPATSACLAGPNNMATDVSGNLYFIDYHAVRMISHSTGTIKRIVGTYYSGPYNWGVWGVNFAGDGGPGTAAMLAAPNSLAVDTSGNVYIADSGPSWIGGSGLVRLWSKNSGNMSTVAGVFPRADPTPNGRPATNTELDNPAGLALDAANNLYVVASNQILIVTPTPLPSSRPSSPPTCSAGTFFSVNTLSCTPCKAGSYSGEMGVSACTPCDSGYTSYVVGATSSATCMPAPKVYIATVAGTGDDAFITDGVAATSSDLRRPSSVAVDTFGNIYIGGSSYTSSKGVGDTPPCAIRKVSKTTGVITTVGGKEGFCGSYGDGGPATLARIDPHGLAVGTYTKRMILLT